MEIVALVISGLALAASIVGLVLSDRRAGAAERLAVEARDEARALRIDGRMRRSGVPGCRSRSRPRWASSVAASGSALETSTTRHGRRRNTEGMADSSSPQLISVGYEGRSSDDLIAILRELDVAVLVDVRMTPLSRKPGLSKTALARSLRAAGIGYVHHRALGNPKENRAGYRAGYEIAESCYQRVLESDEGQVALHHVSELLDGGIIALLCFERDHDQCHRRQVITELESTCEGLQVVRA